MSITHTVKWVWKGPYPAFEWYSLLLLINATFWHLCRSDVIWCIELYFPNAGISTRKQVIDDLYMFSLIFTSLSLFSNMMLLTSPYQILDKHTIIDMFCPKWTSHIISHLRLHLQCNVAHRYPFSLSKSAVIFLSMIICMLKWKNSNTCSWMMQINFREYRRGNQKKENPEKLVT